MPNMHRRRLRRPLQIQIVFSPVASTRVTANVQQAIPWLMFITPAAMVNAVFECQAEGVIITQRRARFNTFARAL